MKSKLSKIFIVICFMSILFAASGVSAIEKIKLDVTASYFPVPHHNMFTYVARDEGFFDKYGVIVNYQPMKSSGDMYKAIAAGQFDVGTTFISQHIDGVARGIPVKAIGSHFPIHYYWYYVAADSPIKTMKDLDGKVIALSGLGGCEHFYVQMAEQKFDIKPKLVASGGGKATFAMVLSGKADVCVRAKSPAMPYLNKGLLKPVQGSAVHEMLPSPWCEGIIWASNSAIKGKQEGLKRYMRAVSDALRLMSDKEYYIKADMKYFKVSRKAATQRQTLYDWTPELTIDPNTVKKAIDYYYEFGLIDKKIAAEQVLDLSLLP